MTAMQEEYSRAKQNEGEVLRLMKEGKVALNDALALEVVEDKLEQAAIAESF